MAGHGEKLSRKQEQAIAALLSCASIPEAAEQLGLAERSLYRWLHDEAFADAYRQARREVVRQAISQLQAACGEAVESLRAIMGNADAPASARVSAARTILETAIKAVELEDVEQRLAAIEQAMEPQRS